MRGTKLTAWQIPPVWKNLQGNVFEAPEGSTVPENQEKMLRVTLNVLEAIAADVRGGLLETVGIESRLSLDEERCSMILELSAGTDTKHIAEAIDAENIEAWCDSSGRVNIAVNPWYSTKDVDQTVLCTIKVIHVLLGLHAVCEVPPRSLKQRLIKSISEIMQIHQNVKNDKPKR